MFCYGKNDDCILFPNKDECEKMDLETLLSVPEEELVKGIRYDFQKNVYDEESLELLKESLSAEMEKKDNNYEIKCGKGQYLEGTFNPDDNISIVGGVYKDCSDPNHPEYDKCQISPSPSSSSYYLSELITTRGKKFTILIKKINILLWRIRW